MASPTLAPAKPRKAKARKAIEGVRISPDERVSLYAQARYLPLEFRRKSGLELPFVTYFQDPFVAKTDPAKGFDEKTQASWEPGLLDGPTSARFAVVDYDADNGTLEPPAVWSEDDGCFLDASGTPIDKSKADTFAFHQVNVWVLLQRALAFFEDGVALGRPIPWAFEGNRLIVVPHAGYGENAFYDRNSKSLQFYYFGEGDDKVYTCLSTDIVSHEFGHAVLDGVRPLLNESISVQTAAFHEFFGDLSAILMTMRNNALRRSEADAAKGDLAKAATFASVAEEFGKAVEGRPYLRTAFNQLTMAGMANETGHHRMSQVLTGAMFDILKGLGANYAKDSDGGPGANPASPRQIFWRSADRMQRMAIQPLDLLPPVEVTFRDYALAVCRAHRLADPMDPHDYYGMMIGVFQKRGIFNEEDAARLREPRYLHERLGLSVHHSIDSISRSRAAAYRFLDDNREDLLIPASRDFLVADLYDANKSARQGMPLPRQIILQYVWREEVKLEGARFGKLNGTVTSMLCGGTLVFDETGTVLSWTMKPGSEPYGGKRPRTGKVADAWTAAVAEGTARRQALLDEIGARVTSGDVGSIASSGKGLAGARVPFVTTDEQADGSVRFRLSPHMHLSDDQDLDEESGERKWQISC